LPGRWRHPCPGQGRSKTDGHRNDLFKRATFVARNAPVFALLLAAIAVVLLALGPIGWLAGWWHFRFSLLSLMPWVA